MSRMVLPDQLKPSPLSRRVVRRLREAGLALAGSIDDYALFGLAPGYWQKTQGAWAWELYRREKGHWHATGIGSMDRASSLRKHSSVSYFQQQGGDYDVTIDNRRSK